MPRRPTSSAGHICRGNISQVKPDTIFCICICGVVKGRPIRDQRASGLTMWYVAGTSFCGPPNLRHRLSFTMSSDAFNRYRSFLVEATTHRPTLLKDVGMLSRLFALLFGLRFVVLVVFLLFLLSVVLDTSLMVSSSATGNWHTACQFLTS